MNAVGPVPCPNCGQRTEAYAAACSRCGLPRDLPVYDDQGTFLGTTFAPVRQARPVASPVLPQAGSPATLPSGPATPSSDGVRHRKRRRTLFFVLGGAVVILLGVVAGLILTNQTGPTEEAVPSPAAETTPVMVPSQTPTADGPTTDTSTEPSTNTEPSASSAPSPPKPSPTEVSTPVPEPEPRQTQQPTRPGPPITATHTYQHPGGGSCAVPAGWEPSDLASGRVWRNRGAEVSCENFADDLAAIRAIVEASWANEGWEVTFSDGDTAQYRASGYSPSGDIFWLGAKRDGGNSVATLWVYPPDDKGYYDTHIEVAWTQLSPP